MKYDLSDINFNGIYLRKYQPWEKYVNNCIEEFPITKTASVLMQFSAEKLSDHIHARGKSFVKMKAYEPKAIVK